MCMYVCMYVRTYMCSGEDNCVLRWNLRAGLAHVDVSTFPLPPVSQSMDNDLFLPVLCQNVRMYVHMYVRMYVGSLNGWHRLCSAFYLGGGALLNVAVYSLLQSQQNCVAGAIGSTLCVWKVKDGKSVVHKFPELITTIQFKPAQSDGEKVPPILYSFLPDSIPPPPSLAPGDLPVILVGLVDGNLALAHVHKVKFALTPEIEPTTLTSSIHGT